MRIVFMGTPEFAVPSLEALLRSPDTVVGVVTQPDRPKGRGHDVVPSPIKTLAQRAGRPILQPVKMKDPAFLEALQSWKPDLIAVAAFGRILPQVILDLPPKGCINVHGSLLPKYRGAGPIQWAVIHGERETGITTMLMDAGMDTGAMLLQERVTIGPEETAGELAARLAVIGGRLLAETIEKLKAGTVTPTPQDHSQATLAPMLKKEDGLIDWTLGAIQIANRIRGLSPWPGAYTYFKQDRWTIWRAAAEPGQGMAQKATGMLVEAGKAGLVVTTGKGVLRILELQAANSRRMEAREYIAGHPLASGSLLSSAPERR